MNKFFIFHNADGSIDEKDSTEYEYEIGETISVNNRNNIYKCFHKEVVDGELLQHFKQGRVSYSFDY